MYIDPNTGGFVFFSVVGLIAFLVGAIAYIVPAVIALKRNHPNNVAIIAINLLLGWTVLGWVGALVWSLITPTPSYQQVPPAQ